jgi:ubiquinone/menaquinone biosynthesis C-methylase UbiE
VIAYDTDFASLYDVFYGDKPYDEEASFIHGLLREHGVQPPGRLLDVACGTGQHAVRFANAGWTVVGVDRSAAMLAGARARAGGGDVRFEQQDMTTLNLGGEPFDVATCLFDSIGYAITNERVAATLNGIRRLLRPDGLFVVEFWHAAAMLTSYDPRRERTWNIENGAIRRVSQTALDVTRQVARVDYIVERLDGNGTIVGTATELHENRFFLTQEMGLFLSEAGFEVVDWYGGFDREKPIDQSTWHLLALARAGGDTSR